MVGLFVVAVALLTRLVTPSREGVEERDRELAELDAADPGWRWDDLNAAHLSKLPPADENIMDRAGGIGDHFPQNWRAWRDLPPDEEQKSDPGPLSAPPACCLPSKNELARARKLVGMCRELVSEARSLRHLKTGGATLELEPNPLMTTLRHLEGPRRLAELLEQDALLAAADGNPDDALDDALALLALARGIGEDPFLASQLFRGGYAVQAARVAERALGLGEPSAAKLAEVRDALLAEAEVPRLWVGLRGDRALLYKLTEEAESGVLDTRKLLETEAFGSKVFAVEVLEAFTPHGQAHLLRVLNRVVAAAKLPPGPDRAAAFAAIDRDLKADTTTVGKGVWGLLIFFSPRWHDHDAETVAVLRAAAVAVECERHRLKQGTFPDAPPALPEVAPAGETLTQLTRLEEVPTDPFTGKPMRYKLEAGHVTVYSTGPNGVDDGAKLYDPLAPIVWPRPPADLGVRLFHPKHRRQPPADPTP